MDKVTIFVETEKSKIISTTELMLDLPKTIRRYWSEDKLSNNDVNAIIKDDEALSEVLYSDIFDDVKFTNSKWDGKLLTTKLSSKRYPEFKMIFVSNPEVDWGFEHVPNDPPEKWSRADWNELANTLLFESDIQILVNGRRLT